MEGEDGTRTDLDFMCKTVEAAIKNGASTINIPDIASGPLPSQCLIGNYILIIVLIFSTSCTKIYVKAFFL